MTDVGLRWESRNEATDADGSPPVKLPLALSALSLNEQVHRELRRVEAAATTDNEPESERTEEEKEEDTQSPRTGDGATCRGSDFPRPWPIRIRACVTVPRDLKFYA